MPSETNSNEAAAPTPPPAERVLAQGASSLAVGESVSHSTIITGAGNQLGHRAGGDVVVGDQTVINNHLSLKWLAPILLVIAAGVCVIAWQAGRTGGAEENKPRPMAMPAPTSTATPTPTPNTTPTARPKKRRGSGGVIVEQKVEKNP